MIDLKEALQIVLDSARPLGTERVELSDALGRILAEDVTADMDVPPFDKATVDGYACRRADLGNAADRDRDDSGGPDACEGDRSKSVRQDHDRALPCRLGPTA